MENNNKKPRFRFNIWWLLGIFAAIILIAIMAVTIKHFTTSSDYATHDYNFYRSVLTKILSDITDGTAFKSVEHNPYQNIIKFTLAIDPAHAEFFKNLGISETAIKSGEYVFTLNASSTQISQWEIFDELNNVNAFTYKLNGKDFTGKLFATPYPTPTLSSKIWSVMATLLPIMAMVFIGYLIYRSMMRNMGDPFSKDNTIAQRIKTDKKFSDIAGNEEVKEEVWELVDYLKNPKKYAIAGARIPKGILLGGPPGTGKTLIAKATAGEANVPFFFISASNFVEMFVGLGAKRVRDMFAEARKNAPAIIFIDELDAVGRSRGAGIGGGNDEREQTLNQLLVEMDGIKENSGILIMAATNRTDVLDPALLRPGRFDRVITVSLPDIKEREAILKLHARGKRISKDIKFNLVARRTPGFSGAQLENVINEASLLSVREKTGVITIEQIDEAIDRVIAGPAKKSRTISEKENVAVAYHEAGHAVVGLKVPGGNKVQKITIIPRGHAGGYNLMLPE